MTSYQTASGRINVIEFLSSKPVNDTILCIHGTPSDARIFNYVGAKLSQAGYNVMSMDLPGHGSSEGQRGDLDFEKCLQSINQIVVDIKKKSRVFIMAHSMGSTFALWYAHLFKNSIDGLIILCPYIRIAKIKRSDADPSVSTFLYLLLRRIFTPQSTVDFTRVVPKYVEASGEEFAKMVRNKMVNLQYSYRYLVDVMASRNSKVAELADISDPVFLLHGQRDRNVYSKVSEEYLKLLRSPKKELKIFDCDHWFYDALYFDQESPTYSEESRERFVSSIIDWIGRCRE
jgi:alpha-beta hydrolase superfamily lysophospholipase